MTASLAEWFTAASIAGWQRQLKGRIVNSFTLGQVALRARFHCALCGQVLAVRQVDDHAKTHAEHGEALTYGAFAASCAGNPGLEGLPVLLADGSDGVWPFEMSMGEQPAHAVEAQGARMAWV